MIKIVMVLINHSDRYHYDIYYHFFLVWLALFSMRVTMHYYLYLFLLYSDGTGGWSYKKIFSGIYIHVDGPNCNFVWV